MTVSVDAIAKAQAIYTPFSLAFYDLVVHGLSNRLAWCCSTSAITQLYARHVSDNHLEAAVGTGMFLDPAGVDCGRLALLDLNPHCLKTAAKRLKRFHPETYEVNLLAPLHLDLAPFRSVGLTYVLHCLPGTMAEKLVAIDHLRPLMAEDAVLFGATILGKGVEPNLPARILLNLYNEKGVFNNLNDDLATLETGLRTRFSNVDISQEGLVALFSAR